MYVTIDGTTVNLTILDSTGVYDYSWSEFAVMRGDDGYLYVASDSGCSCNYFGDAGFDPDDVTRVKSWQDAAAKAQEWAGDGPCIDEERKGCMDMIERLTNTRPPAFDPSAVVMRGQTS